jgi:hypothetical protein
MATLEDEHTDAATHDIPDALTPPTRQSPGPYLHDVYRAGDDGWLLLVMEAVEVKARGLAGRQEAIAKATASSKAVNSDEQYGTFRVVKHGEMSDPITRNKKVVEQDDWS